MLKNSSERVRRLISAVTITLLLLALQKGTQNRSLPLQIKLTKPLITVTNFIA